MSSFSLKMLHTHVNRPYPSSPSAFDMEIIFHSPANKTHFHKKGCAPSLILKVRVFGTRKWPIVLKWCQHQQQYKFPNTSEHFFRTLFKSLLNHQCISNMLTFEHWKLQPLLWSTLLSFCKFLLFDWDEAKVSPTGSRKSPLISGSGSAIKRCYSLYSWLNKTTLSLA